MLVDEAYADDEEYKLGDKEHKQRKDDKTK